MRVRRNPDVDQQPIPPDEADKLPVILPPNEPGHREEDEPDPPPLGDPPNNEPTRILAL